MLIRVTTEDGTVRDERLFPRDTASTEQGTVSEIRLWPEDGLNPKATLERLAELVPRLRGMPREVEREEAARRKHLRVMIFGEVYWLSEGQTDAVWAAVKASVWEAYRRAQGFELQISELDEELADYEAQWRLQNCTALTPEQVEAMNLDGREDRVTERREELRARLDAVKQSAEVKD
jgi:hypothetical protein